MGFPERLKSLREHQRYSLEELSKLIGVRGNTIWRWENHKAKPDTDSLIRVAHALDTTAAYLLGETDNPACEGAKQQIQNVLALAEKISNEEDSSKAPITAGMSEHSITITDSNTNFTYRFPNNEEGRKSLALFLKYSIGMKNSAITNEINGDNNSGNKMGLINN